MRVENIKPESHNSRSPYTPCKKIDMGGFYMIYVSGVQAPKNDVHAAITDDVAEQTKLVFEEIGRILSLAGASLDNVVKSVIYLTDMADFSAVAAIRDEYFKNSAPVSTLVEVNAMTRKGAKVEVEVTALLEK